MSAVRLAIGAHPDADLIARAAAALLEDKVALLPAEGVYGFHARASSAIAIERIRALKRDPRAGFIGLIAEPGDLERWAHASPHALELARRYWPGALTLVLDARPEAPESLRSESGTIALRCPGSDLLRGVVQGVGEPVLSTSANRSGEPPALRADDAPSGVADLIVDGGVLDGRPSTLVRVGPKGVEILRQGAVRLGDGSLDGLEAEP
ncbi:MAG TPA: Sua5/YciO/YrdC/YwlC family protein [Candidatus Eisenbacteria bacterium]|nr:Sua5/YciO/YrdC/YwlC family protein [Candidatus Eisenbacteria bacterium]